MLEDEFRTTLRFVSPCVRLLVSQALRYQSTLRGRKELTVVYREPEIGSR